MKSAAQTKKQPSKPSTKASRPATPARHAEPATPRIQAASPRPAAPAASAPSPGNTTIPMPDLKAFGVDQGSALAHIGQCEQCGRAHRHVAKNPKDVMAIESFGRNLAVCLAGKQAKTPA